MPLKRERRDRYMAGCALAWLNSCRQPASWSPDGCDRDDGLLCSQLLAPAESCLQVLRIAVAVDPKVATAPGSLSTAGVQHRRAPLGLRFAPAPLISSRRSPKVRTPSRARGRFADPAPISWRGDP